MMTPTCRQALRYIIRNTTLPQRARAQAQLQLSQMHCYTRFTQINNRCIEGGKCRGVLKDFRMARVCAFFFGSIASWSENWTWAQYPFRINALAGNLPGVKKASWWCESSSQDQIYISYGSIARRWGRVYIWKNHDERPRLAIFSVIHFTHVICIHLRVINSFCICNCHLGQLQERCFGSLSMVVNTNITHTYLDFDHFTINNSKHHFRFLQYNFNHFTTSLTTLS